MSKRIVLPRLNQIAASIAVVAGGMAFIPSAFAAAPAVGTNISNVATASYLDSTSKTQRVTSNVVQTTVLQVASFILEADRTKTVNPGDQVSMAHTLTNTGNGTDTFTLNLVNVGGDDYNFSGLRIYAADNNGNAINTINLIGQTVSVNAGESFNFVVVGTTSGTANNGDLGLLEVSASNVYSTTAAGGNNAATTTKNTDTVKLVAGPVIDIKKAASLTTVKTSDSVANRTIEYTLTYQNIGNAVATNVLVEDTLPANVTYVAGSAKWSGSATARTDADDAETGVKYKFDSASGKVTAVLDSVGVNATGTLKFKVVVNTTAPAGNIINQAIYDRDGDGPETPTTPTNPAVTKVEELQIGTINDSQTDAYADADKDTGNTAKDDLITATTTQGTPVNFGNNGGETIWIHNTGNVTNAYNLSVNKSGLPAGSIVELLKDDGVTPLTDTNGDPAQDTGPIAAGAAQKIVVRVTLPVNYTGPVTAPGLDTIVTITPVNNANATPDTLTLRITAITAAKVDLSNGKGDENGIDDDTPKAGEGQNTTYIVDDKSTKPGVPVTFPLAVTNFGTGSDNFNVSSDLPSGWKVEYFISDAAGNCSNSKVTNTGNILAGQTAYLCAVVTPPNNATPSDSRDISFTVSSPATGLSDTLKDHVAVEAARSLTFVPDRQGQVSQDGGTVTYTHTLTNIGNVTEGAGGAGQSTLPLSVTSSLAGVSASVYVDLNNNGAADANELVTAGNLTALLAGTPGGAGLQPGESVSIIVKVQVPAGVTPGQQDLTTVTITPTGNINGNVPSSAVKVEDTTTVGGGLDLIKYQALDAACDGTADTAFSNDSAIKIQAKPGACIIYKIDAINRDINTVTNVVISDAAPVYTTLTTPAPALIPSSKGTPVVSGSSISTPGFALDPSEKATLQFSVKINN